MPTKRPATDPATALRFVVEPGDEVRRGVYQLPAPTVEKLL